ncbi:DoxX family protein [Occallatibacter savannae]|uniref:DoxX family protein n=1 Tax=Occallatibacter savannae TaxID=1002691 RepID=UPI000D68B62D|nr:DoxX family protein [Occallatibacter savannae]
MTDAIQELPEPAPKPDEAPRRLRFPNSAADWAIRALFFVIFLYFGTAKFKSDPGAPWVILFEKIGLGQWLRYFTGALEAVGAFLVLIPSAVEAGLAILILIAFAATICTLFVLREFSGAFVPFSLLCGMIALWLHRRRV